MAWANGARFVVEGARRLGILHIGAGSSPAKTRSHAFSRAAPRGSKFPSAAPIASLALLAAACGWDHLDAVGPALRDTDAPDAAAADAEAAEAATAADASLGIPDAPAGADALDASENADAPDATDGPPDAESSALACTAPPSAVRQWTFDVNTEGWQMTTLADAGIKATLAWTASTGNPSPGALQVDALPGAQMGAWLEFPAPLGDLTGRTVSAWVWLESGPSPHFKFFLQTATRYAWADNGTVLLAPHTWTCVSLPVSSPSYSQPSYDPTNVVVLGFEMFSSAPFRLYVDSIRY